ncbi:hypothetical protein DYU32_21815 [Salmonella enterica]|nr:hypothetical protein [Salmonella enterica]EAS3176889.1 hypothetical protein [Salmonella enterica]MKB87726.1 hypothetical protein [Salmonella enterica]
MSFQGVSGYHDDRRKGWITIAVRIEGVLINFFDKILITVRMPIINILRHSRRFFRCACKALLPAAP